MNNLMKMEDMEIESVSGGLAPIVAFGLAYALTFTATTALIGSEIANNNR